MASLSPSHRFIPTTLTNSTPSPSKRNITPRSELSSPVKRVTISKLASPDSIKTATQEMLPPPRFELSSMVQNAKHGTISAAASSIELNLKLHPTDVNDAANRELLYAYFRGCKLFGFDEFMLIFHLDELPAKPWPNTIAEVPCYLTTDKEDRGPLSRIQRNPIRGNKIHLLKEVNAHIKNFDDNDNTATFEKHLDTVFRYFKEKDIEVTQLQNLRTGIVIVLTDKDQDTPNLPAFIMNLRCYKWLDDEIKRGDEPALRTKEPNTLGAPDFDNSQYNPLRPGVMVTSDLSGDGSSRTTTSGVLVQDGSGRKYLTVAAHGFPEGGNVYHPRNNGRVIGTIDHTCSGEFDIALVKLKDGETFVNEIFQSTEDDDTRKLTALAPSDSRTGDTVSMNSPFMGENIGTVAYPTYKPGQLSIEGEPDQHWVRAGDWVWNGQGSSLDMRDGVCGTPLIDSNDRVIGFFRFAGKGAYDDHCFFTGSENLRSKGYKLCID